MVRIVLNKDIRHRGLYHDALLPKGSEGSIIYDPEPRTFIKHNGVRFYNINKNDYSIINENETD